MENRTIEEMEDLLIDEFVKFWGNRVKDFVVSNSTDVPYRMLNIEFTLYNYILIRIILEHNSVFFSDVSKGICLNLLPIAIDVCEVSRCLKEIDSEVRLRIPDKYLRAKGW